MTDAHRTKDLRLTLLLIVLALSGCAPGLKEGEVTDKGFKPAQTVMIMMPLTTCTGGKYMTCTTMLLPMFFYYPDRWYVDIKKFTGKKWESATWWVPQDVYSQVTVGGYFKVATYGERCLADEPRTRVEKSS